MPSAGQCPDRPEGALWSEGWVATLPVAFRRDLLAAINWREFAQGESLGWAGDGGGGLWGISLGHVGLASANRLPGMSIGHVAHAGTWWGVGPLLGFERAADATALTPVSAACVSIRTMRRLLELHPEAWRNLGVLAHESAILFGTATSDLMIRSSELRCVAVLLRLAGQRGVVVRARVASIPVSHDQLASMANLSRATTGEILRSLRRRGLVELGYSEIRISRPDKLAQVLDAGLA